MGEELDHIQKIQTWKLVPKYVDKNVIGKKWELMKKIKEDGQVTKNKEIGI